jgi:hypothetical protein
MLRSNSETVNSGKGQLFWPFLEKVSFGWPFLEIPIWAGLNRLIPEKASLGWLILVKINKIN